MNGVACLRQLDEPVIQRDDLGWLAEQVALDGPLLVHLGQATFVSAGPVTVCVVAGLAAGSGRFWRRAGGATARPAIAAGAGYPGLAR